MSIIYEKKDRIALITINRPEAMNALNVEAMEELEEVWLDFRDDDNIWVAIITGA
ncbi:MAG: enoyl-CoA hydratase, partial [Clostridia bacterium]|nr:enoyl-CoA hydratase [Clostridia bacterium]